MSLTNLDIKPVKNSLELATLKITNNLFFSFGPNYKIDICFGLYALKSNARRVIVTFELKEDYTKGKQSPISFYSKSHFDLKWVKLYKKRNDYFLDIELRHKKIMGLEIEYFDQAISNIDYRLYLKLLQGQRPTSYSIKEIKGN
jgi:hypothetical protein